MNPRARHRPDTPDVVARDGSVPRSLASEYRRVAWATTIGTTLEWYDYFVYASLAAIAFPTVFFAGAGGAKELVAIATIGVSFVFRPLGALVLGPVGDRWGRRFVLVLALLLMGVATAAIGLLPTTDTIGMAAPATLVVLRCLQGFSAGGEWPGAAMLAVEHAPRGERGRYGGLPQLGVPFGLILATGVVAALTTFLSPEAFLEWGWRVPFLLSVTLVLFGLWLRRTVEESPVFRQLEAGTTSERPRRVSGYAGQIALAAATFMGNIGLAYMIVGGVLMTYGTSHGMARTQVLLAIIGASVVWAVASQVGAILSDAYGRVHVYTVGYGLMAAVVVPAFWLASQASLATMVAAMVLMAVPIGLTYGPQPAMFAEMFPGSVRLSAVAVANALGAMLGGAVAPLVAELLTNRLGWPILTVSGYLLALALISLFAVRSVHDRSDEPLSVLAFADTRAGSEFAPPSEVGPPSRADRRRR